MATPAAVRLIESGPQAGALAISTTFQWQSFFGTTAGDTTTLQKAIVVQPTGTQIVAGPPNTKAQEQQQRGRFLTLHPSSQTPVCVTAKASGRGGAVATFTLVPGQAVAPFGGEEFRSFTWGLPFGWLGGGIATLIVSQSKYQPEGLSTRPEIPFHRARFAIQQPAVGITDASLNWPIRFPWVQAVNSGSIAQGGGPVLAPEPTRIVMYLNKPGSNVGGLGAPAAMACILEAPDDLALDYDGTQGDIDQAKVTQEIVNWPAYQDMALGGNLAHQQPVVVIDASTASGAGKGLLRLGCSSVASAPGVTPTACGVVFLDATGAAVLNGLYVDIVRYGRL